MTLPALLIAIGILNFHSGSSVEGSEESRSRSQRDILLFPEGSLLQLSVGVSSAFDLVGEPSGQISYVYQQNAVLPGNYTEILFPPTVREKRSTDVYRHLQDLFGRYKMFSNECLKKAICQIAQKPLEGGILEEIINFVFTPSHHEERVRKRAEEDPFLFSESVGRNFGDCHSAFPNCRRSPLDVISHLEE